MKSLIFVAISTSLCFSCAHGKTVDHTHKITEQKEKTKMDKLIIDDVVVGTGLEAKAKDHVSVHYTGTLMDGTKFDSSHDRGQPLEFPLGVGYVIKGWDEGVQGMKVGGKRVLTIPSSMAYGEHGAGASIPPHSDLKFEVELMAVNGNTDAA